MDLAVFARGLDHRPTGRGLVARELIKALRRVRPDIHIHVFAPADAGWPAVTHSAARGAALVADAWRMWRGAANDLKRLRPDALWCATHVLPSGLPPALKTVVTLLDVVWRDRPDTMDWRHRLTALYGERGLFQADRIVCISEFTRTRLAHYWPDLESCARVVRLAPSSSLLKVSCPSSPNNDRPVVANVGTIEPRKNLGLLLDAMTRLPEATLIQYGTIGWKVSDLVARAIGMSNVRLLGYQDDQAVQRLYCGATVAVFPSFYEGFHLPPLEAMALGCPVIASDIPAHREILGDAAIYVGPSDSYALAAALQHVIADPVERSRLARAGREQAARYSWDSSARALAGIIEEVYTL